MRAGFGSTRDYVLLEPFKLDAATDYQFRKALREKKIKVQLVKNSYAKKIFAENGLNFGDVWSGPTLLCWGGANIKELSNTIDKTIKDLKKDAKAPDKFKIKTAVSDGHPVTMDVAKTLPTREEAIGNVLGCVLAPGAHLAALLLGASQQLAELLKALVETGRASTHGDVRSSDESVPEKENDMPNSSPPTFERIASDDRLPFIEREEAFLAAVRLKQTWPAPFLVEQLGRSDLSDEVRFGFLDLMHEVRFDEPVARAAAAEMLDKQGVGFLKLLHSADAETQRWYRDDLDTRAEDACICVVRRLGKLLGLMETPRLLKFLAPGTTKIVAQVTLHELSLVAGINDNLGKIPPTVIDCVHRIAAIGLMREDRLQPGQAALIGTALETLLMTEDSRSPATYGSFKSLMNDLALELLHDGITRRMQFSLRSRTTDRSKIRPALMRILAELDERFGTFTAIA